jgi:hypothetical protein
LLPAVEDVPYIGSPGAQRHGGTDVCAADIKEVIFKSNLSFAFYAFDRVVFEVKAFYRCKVSRDTNDARVDNDSRVFADPAPDVDVLHYKPVTTA